MSIIYDALKKTQAQRAAAEFEKLMMPPAAETTAILTPAPATSDSVSTQTAEPSPSQETAAIAQEPVTMYPSRRTIFIILTAITLSVGLAHLLITHYPQQRPIAPKPLPTHLHQLKMQLDGVFLGGKDKRAMINHHLYSEGDQIDGFHIVAIEEERVKLQDDQHTLELHMR